MVLEPLPASVGCDAKSLPCTISKLKLQAVSIATLSTEFRNNNACKTSPSVKRGCSLWGLGKVVTRSGSIKPIRNKRSRHVKVPQRGGAWTGYEHERMPALVTYQR